MTGATLPRHLHAVPSQSAESTNGQLILTAGEKDSRLAALALRHHAQLLSIPHRLLGARLNHAVLYTRAEWLIFPFQGAAVPSAWQPIFSQLDTHLLDAAMIGIPQPTLTERLLQRFLPPTTPVPPYLAVTRTWLEKIGGFDAELDLAAPSDLLQRLMACPTRIKALDVDLHRRRKTNVHRLDDENNDINPTPPPPTQLPS
ncbi:hypothetical protein R5M92_14170 [Halomonas sp. Bachu 37]|uniref:hypothetical protein n=1 Tax=Halomonas kashgarensis TaxID=3084920 RepID=UPI0032179890